MRRVIILGPGGSGKSTLATHLGSITGLPVIELDKVFWRPGLAATPSEEWAEIQRQLVEEDAWILDGDLGPYDAVEVRLPRADTIIFLDFSFIRCAWRVIRRSRERADFWLWLWRYRRRSRPHLIEMIGTYAPGAALFVIPDPVALKRLVEDVEAHLRAGEPRP